MTSLQTDPPDVPEELVAALGNSADGQLRALTDYARPLLSEQPPATGAVEPRQGDKNPLVWGITSSDSAKVGPVRLIKTMGC